MSAMAPAALTAVALLGQLVRPTAAVRVALFGGDGDCELQTGARPIGCTQLSESTAVLYRYDRSSRQALRRFHYETPTCDDGSPSRSSPMSFTRCTPTEDGLSEQLIEDDNHTAAASSGDQEAEDWRRFTAFRETWGREYSSPEEAARRYQVFRGSLHKIEALNADAADAAVYGVGKFADKMPSELPRLRRPRGHGARRALDEAPGKCSDPETGCVWSGECYSCHRFPKLGAHNGTLPTSIDWTQLGAVTAVKDQGDCSDCFTFSTTGNVEGAWFLAGHDLVSLSEQQLTSCDRTGDDGGCEGDNTMLDTFSYIQRNGGISSEHTYPLCSWNTSCTAGPGCTNVSRGHHCKHARLNGICNKQLEARPTARISGYFQISGGTPHSAEPGAC